MKRLAVTIIAMAVVSLCASAVDSTYVRHLVSQLTLEEKAALMRFESPAVPRLGIPEYNWWNEALHGVARNGYATMFPMPIGMAASFDEKLLYEVFDAVSDEAIVKYRQGLREKADNPSLSLWYKGLSFWTPNINIFRDPRWGRGMETYGEDPYLTGVMGCAVVRGLQGAYGEKYTPAPSIMQYIPAPNTAVTILMRGCRNATCARHIYPHSRILCKRQMCRR